MMRVIDTINMIFYKIGAWWKPGPLRVQGNPIQRWIKYRCIGRKRQTNKMYELIQKLDNGRFK